MVAGLDDLVQAGFLQPQILQEETALLRLEHGDLFLDPGADHDHFGLFGFSNRPDPFDIFGIGPAQLVFGHIGDIEDGF